MQEKIAKLDTSKECSRRNERTGDIGRVFLIRFSSHVLWHKILMVLNLSYKNTILFYNKYINTKIIVEKTGCIYEEREY